MEAPAGGLIFRVHIHEGVDFGPELAALSCHVTLGGSTRATPFSVQRDRHAFDTLLQWSLSKQQWRRLSSTGQFICKVSVFQRRPGGGTRSTPTTSNPIDQQLGDLTRLGWVVLDLRQAKLNKQYNKDQGGDWYTLIGGKPGGLPPKLRISYAVEDDILRTLAADQALADAVGKQLATPPREAQPAPPDAAAPVDQGRQVSTAPLPTAPLPLAALPLSPGSSSSAGDDDVSDTHSADDSRPASPGRDAQGTDVAGAEPGRSATPLAPPPPPLPPRTPGGGSGVTQADHGTTQSPQGPALAAPHMPPAAIPFDDGPTKAFTLTVDVRSFQAGRHLPLGAAVVYVQAWLPDGLNELVAAAGARIPARFAPLTSRPAVEVVRGGEQPIPNGVGSCEFACGVTRLAQLLAREPRVTVNVWHKERDASDVLLGVASIPLTPLLHDCWVDGLAPVYALRAGGEMTAKGGAAAAAGEKVQVGTLRIVLALQDGPAEAEAGLLGQGSELGRVAPLPAPPTPPPPAPSLQQARHQTLDSATWLGETAVPTAERQLGDATAGRPLQQTQLPPVSGPPPAPSPQRADRRQAPSPPAQPAHAGGLLGNRAREGAGASGPAGLPETSVAYLQQLPEYEAAYQIEVWKKAEEVRWRAELSSREAARMAVLESEWRRRDKARDEEMGTMRAEYLELEARTRQMLASVEQRERRLVGLEEGAALRRRDMEREHAARMAEAEAAVRRLQVECEHQLEIERDRNAELARLRAAAEERAVLSEARCAAVEQAFANYREQVRATSEVQLAQELSAARERARRAEDKVSRLLKAKAAYRTQVVRLAEHVAALQRSHAAAGHSAALMAAGLPGAQPPQSRAIQLAADQQARYASAQHAELEGMRQQLAALKHTILSSPEDVRVPGSAAGPGGPAVQAPHPSSNQARGPTPPQSAPPALAHPVPLSVPAEPRPASAPAGPPAPLQQATQPQPASAPQAVDAGEGARGRGARPSALPGHVGIAHNSDVDDDGDDISPQVTPTRSRPSQDLSHLRLLAGDDGGTPTGVGGASVGLPGMGQGPGPATGKVGAGAATGSLRVSTAAAGLPAEIQRLLRRKSDLLATGAYPLDDPLIMQIEARITQLAGLP